MAGLFSMPTPEAVRQEARDRLFANARAIAQAPAGRGFVQAASMAGGLLGQAVAGPSKQEQQAVKFQAVQQDIMGEVQKLGLNVSEPEGFLKMTEIAAQKFTDAGMPDFAQQAAAQGLQVRGQFAPKPEDKFEPIFDADGNIIAQRNLRTNKVIKDPRAPEDPDTVIQNYLGDEPELAKSLAKAFGKDIVERRKDVLDARQSLISTNKAIDLLNSGAITGFGAEFITGTGKALQQIGFNFAENEIANTEAFYANQAQAVAQIIKAFGAGTGLSDADREFAKRAAAGELSMTEESIRRVLDINQRAFTNLINNFNTDIDKLPENVLPFDLKIQMPKVTSPLKDAGKPGLTPEQKKLRDQLMKGR